MASINLGNMFQLNGRTVLGGGNTGIDTESLIKSLVEAKSIPITQFQDRVDLNSRKLTAVNELKKLVSNFQAAANFLRNPTGLNSSSTNIFQYRGVALSSSVFSTPENYVSVTANPGAGITSLSIDVQNVAKRTIQTSGVLAGVADMNASVVEAAPTANRFTAGVLELKPGVTVDLEAGDSLNDILAKINSQSATTKVSASVIQVATNQYALQFSSTQTGTDSAFDVNVAANTDPGGVLENLAFTPTQNAEDAVVSVNGVAVTSQTNTISSAIPNVTITVKQETLGSTVVADIAPDAELTQDAVTNFINAYNELRVFAARQNERDDEGLPLDTAVLANNSTLRAVLSQTDALLNRVVGGISGIAPNSLSSIGITYADSETEYETEDGETRTLTVKNVLQVDTAALTAAIVDDYNAFSRVFGFDFQADSPDLAVYTPAKNLTVNGFSLAIDTTAGTAIATYDIGAGPVTVNFGYSAYDSGVTLTAPDDSAFEGMVLIYASLDNATIDVTATQGLGDLLYNSLTDMLDEDDGLLFNEIDMMTKADVRLNSNIEKLETQIDRYREVLINKFSQLEQALANVNTLLNALEANTNARDNA